MRGVAIEVRNLTKRFGQVAAVTDLSFTVTPGVVTGFLGPNGSGKSTTMRMILGLVRPSGGTATIGGLRYPELPRPASTVGAVFDGPIAHPACTARDHLRIYAAMAGVSHRRVEEVLDQLVITSFADRPVRGYSTGMVRRLGLATALLGDPPVLLLDEPGNGLDPRGMAWLRDLLRDLAGQGRTILVSSHVLSELELVADHAVVIRDGRLVTSAAVAELSAAARPAVLVRSPDADRLAHVVADRAAVERTGPDGLRLDGIDTADVAELAAAHGLRVHELTPERPSLEQVFLTLVGGEPEVRR